jgi:5-methylcytosine-specific restriction enzyme subunit McrC
MIVGCYALRAPRGFLVYPQGPESGPVPHRVGDIAITDYPLDLDQPPAELLKQIRILAEAIIDL